MLGLKGCRTRLLATGAHKVLLGRSGSCLSQTGNPVRLGVALTTVALAASPRLHSAYGALGVKSTAPSKSPAGLNPKGLEAGGGPRRTPPPPIPARLLIFHASTGRVAFLGFLRLGTLILSIFLCLVVAPACLRAGEPLWKVGAAILCGAAPFAWVYYFTSPFVAFIHLRLPPFARQSRELLKRFASSVPGSAVLDVTTMTLVGKPRVTKVLVSSVFLTRARLGLVNYAVRPGPSSTTVPAGCWSALRTRPPTSFSIQHNSHRDAREGWVWDSVAAAIARRS